MLHRDTPSASLKWLLLLMSTFCSSANAADLLQHCRPIHALEDFRPNRPAEVADHLPHRTYYLFDNLDLFQYRLRLLNISSRTLQLDGNAWISGLSLIARLDGVVLDSSQIAFEITDRSIHRIQYTRNGSKLKNVGFRLRVGGMGAVPDQPFSGSYREVEPVESLPNLLAPNEEFVVDVSVSSTDPAKRLEHGLYTVNFNSVAPAVDCGQEGAVVAWLPESPQDIVDDHVVRYRYLTAVGDLDSAGVEIRNATRIAPGNPRAWYHLAVFAFKTGDLDLRAAAVRRMRDLMIADKTLKTSISSDILPLIEYVVSRLSEYEQEAAELADSKGRDLTADPQDLDVQ